MEAVNSTQAYLDIMRRAEQPPEPTICPICDSRDYLRRTNGMLLCPKCCWAVEVKSK